MRGPRSIRLRLSLATAGVLLLLGVALGGGSYLWLESSLEKESRGFALHEAQEVANLVAGLTTRDEIFARRPLLDGLVPEDGVLGLAIFDLEGLLVYGLPARSGPWSEPWPEGFRAARAGRSLYEHVRRPGLPASLRTALLVEYGREPRWLVTALISEESEIAALAHYRRVYGAGLAAALVLGFFGCLALLTAALRPLGELVDSAARLKDGSARGLLDEPPEGSELRELATLLNAMLERDRRALDNLRRFTSHAGHELRTPLARIRAEAERALMHGGPETQRECIASIMEEAEDLGAMVDALLELARGEESELPGKGPLDLQPLLEELVERATRVDEDRDVKLLRAAGNEPAWVEGTRVLLDHALWNLIDNALKFGRPGGRIEIRVAVAPDTIEVQVADDGTGLGGADEAELFQPFRRGESGSQGIQGHGLGLSLSRAVLRRHGGDLAAGPDGSLGGSRFTARLPRCAADRVPPIEASSGGAGHRQRVA